MSMSGAGAVDSGADATTIERICSAAANLFVKRSYADVTIDQVADAAGLTKGAVYHYFESKEALYVETLLRDLERKRRLYERAIDSEGSCRDRLRELTASFLSLPELERKLAQLVRRDANIFSEATRRKLVDAYHEAVTTPIERILRDGMRDCEIIPCDPRLLAWQFVALVEVMLNDYAYPRFGCDDDRLSYIMGIFLRGCAWTAGAIV